MYPELITPLNSRSLYFTRNSGPPDKGSNSSVYAQLISLALLCWFPVFSFINCIHCLCVLVKGLNPFLLFPGADSYIQEVPRHGWVCTVCNYTSSNQYNTVRHVLSLHLKIKDLICTLCPRRFATINNRQVHYKRIHGLKLSSQEITRMVDQYCCSQN